MDHWTSTHWLSVTMLAVVIGFELQNLVALTRWKVLSPSLHRCFDFTLVIPLWGDPASFAEQRRRAWMKPHTLVAIHLTNPAMAGLADELEREGWRVFRTTSDNPLPPTLLAAALEAGAVTTKYVLRLDADTRVDLSDVAWAVAAIRADGATSAR